VHIHLWGEAKAIVSKEMWGIYATMPFTKKDASHNGRKRRESALGCLDLTKIGHA